MLGILLLKHQTSSLIQLQHWWDGFSLWLWLRLLFADTFLKSPCEGGRLKHMPWSAWEHRRACVPAAVWWPPIAAAWHGSYRELKDTCATEPQELEYLLIHLRSRCLDFVGCVRHSLAEASDQQLNPTEILVGWLPALAVTALVVCRPVPKVSMWRRQIEAHALKCLGAREGLRACCSLVTPYSCCLTRQLSRAEGHLCDRTPRAWMPFDSAWE